LNTGPAPGEPPQSGRFLALYALAWAGGSAAYIPILTVLLPARVTEFAGASAVSWLAAIAFCGAVAASLANILAGLLSDVARRRRWPALAGLAGYALLTPLFAVAETLPQFLVLIAAWQSALNLLLAPLAAWAADSVPDRQKGLLGGLLAFAPATGAAAGALATLPLLTALEARLTVVVGLVACAVLPVVLFGHPRAIPALEAEDDRSGAPRKHGAAARMWLARLLVQISEATLFAYLYLWLRGLDSGFDQAEVARLFLVMLALGIPVSLVVGRWSDRHGEPIGPLRAGAGIAAAGLAAMALAQTTELALLGYAAFTLATAVFLSLHSAQVLRVLPKRSRRGRDLGIFNLTNTVPSLIMPALTIALVPQLGFSGLFGVLAALALLAPFVLPRG
jgi:MFS family permease